MEKTKGKNIGVRLDQDIVDTIEKGKSLIYKNSFKKVNSSTFIREAILAYTQLLERDDDIVRGLNNKDRLKKFAQYQWNLATKVETLESLIVLNEIRNKMSPMYRGKQLWKSLNNESERSRIPFELRFKTEKACVQYYINQDLEMLESDHSPLIVGRKFADCLKEEELEDELSDLEFYQQTKLQAEGKPNKLDEIINEDHTPIELPNIKGKVEYEQVEVEYDDYDDDGPEVLSEEESRAILREMFPDEPAFDEPNS